MRDPLFESYALNDELTVNNRIVMAPLTRCRADNSGFVPTHLMARYYGQRAGAGLIVSEGAIVSPQGRGYPYTHGIWSAEQVEGWKPVTHAVHGAGGRILAISSIGAIRAVPNYTVVGASKGALESLVRHLAVELGPRGITVNTVSAGVVDTDALKKFPNRGEIIGASLARTPLGRLTTPGDVADVVLLLCSDLAGMIHGQVVTVDGGYAIHG